MMFEVMEAASGPVDGEVILEIKDKLPKVNNSSPSNP
jgi:hypothetical protein